MRHATMTDLSEATKPKSAFKICTVAVGKTAGGQKRSKWSSTEKDRYERCLKDVAPKIKKGKTSTALHPKPPTKRGGGSPRKLGGDPRSGSNLEKIIHTTKP